MGAIGLFLLATSLALIQGRPDDSARSQQQWELHPSCEGSDSGLIPHEWACNQYYTCQEGWKSTEPLECASGTHFSVVEQGCVHPGIARCTLPDVPTEEEPVGGDGDDCIDLPNGCPSDFEVYRLLPHETECNKFYYCNFGEKVERDCAPGTYFNATIEVCDWAENVGCAGSGGSGGGGTLDNGCPADFGIHQLLPHESDCSKFYYCEFGELTERDCAPGLHFNATIQVCDWPANAGCESGGGGCTGCPNPDSGENGSGGDGSGGDGSGGDDGGGGGCTGCPNPESGENGSGGDGSGGDGSGGDGGGGGGCTGCPNPDSGENGSGGDDGSDGDDGSGGDDGGGGGCTGCPNPGSGENGSLENGCPSDFSIHQLLPHESDCSKFYYCVFGELVERDCPAGLHFNATIQVCDWPANAGCESGGGGCTGCPNPGSGENGSGGNDSGEGGCTGCPNPGSGENGSGGDDGSLENGCPSDFTIHKLLPHETDCSKFYYCVFGDVIERDCPAGLHFNATAEVCDWPWRAGCEPEEGCTGGGSCSTTTTPGDDGTTSPTPDGGDGSTTTSPGDEDCNTTITPDGGDGTTTTTPGGGDETTTTTPGGDDGTTTTTPDSGSGSTTTTPEGGDGTTTTTPGGGGGSTTTTPEGGDDTTTTTPGGGGGSTTTTPDGGDETTTTTPDGGDGTTTTTPDGGDGTTTTTPGGGGSTTTTTTEGGEDCITETPDERCEENCNIAPFPHEDCDKYWRCEGDKAVLVVCSEGLHFNPVTYTCDFICYAGCVRQTVQTTSDSYGVRVYLPWNTINNNKHAKELIELSKKSEL